MGKVLCVVFSENRYTHPISETKKYLEVKQEGNMPKC